MENEQKPKRKRAMICNWCRHKEACPWTWQTARECRLNDAYPFIFTPRKKRDRK